MPQDDERTRLHSEMSERQKPLVAGRYLLRERLGKGAAGIVFRATDASCSNKEVAVKLLAPIEFKDPIFEARFKQEIALTRDMDHPNVVRVHDFGATDTGQLYVAMEYVSGGALSGRIYDESNPLAFAEVLSILRDVSLGVGFAHSRGIVHRDLKPENILLTETGTAKVADFGLAREMAPGHTMTQSAETVGTPYYMAPEQFRHHRVDSRADIYSLGIVAFEMVNRRRPFVSDVYQQIAMAHMQQPVPSFHELHKGTIPRWFETFVMVCTEKKSDARFQSMEEVSSYLERRMQKMGLLRGETAKEPFFVRVLEKLLGEE